jgi:diadenosine tetraphosphate (Ap4A) HIT family hydrolase
MSPSSPVKPGSAANCEFCAELQSSDRSRFRKIYGHMLYTRIAAKTDNFAALPTIGQLFEGSYLIVPNVHVERYAELPFALQAEASDFVAEIEVRLRNYGPTILFEHGATSAAGTGCGVYHAHIHIVPLPRPTLCEEFVAGSEFDPATLIGAWQAAHSTVEYLVIRDTSDRFALVTNTNDRPQLGSQFMRKRLVQLFGIANHWDWREYSAPEPKLLRSVAALR